MSTELSRRSFLKYSAAAAVAAACSGMLTGCGGGGGSESNGPSMLGPGTHLLNQATVTVGEDIQFSTEQFPSSFHHTIKIPVTIENTGSGKLTVTVDQFWLEVYENYNKSMEGIAFAEPNSKYASLDGDLNGAVLQPGETAQGTLIWSGPIYGYADGVGNGTGDLVFSLAGKILAIHYCPDKASPKYYATWSINIPEAEAEAEVEET